ncbi:MAG: hypothetical protein NWF05_02130 [Candidatus Bathyarchaeota archaeon]|nr:hypothetical protein [Candidatus Bathyarchaeota archaeon]
MSLPKYHLYIEYAQDPEKSGIRFNLSEEELVRTFVNPYETGKPFWFCGRLLKPAKVEKTIIFWSFEDGSTIVLPNREMVAGHPNKKFVMEKICAGRVKGVNICTDKFLKNNTDTTTAKSK